jgi:hypothetical protein
LYKNINNDIFTSVRYNRGIEMIAEELTQAADIKIKSEKKQNDFKHFYCKLPKPSWTILKKAAVMQDDTMVNVLCYLLSKYEKTLIDKFDKIK